MPIPEVKPARGMRTALASVKRSADTHVGLWLDKGLSVMNPASETDKQEIRNLLNAAAETPRPDGYEEAFERRRRFLESFDGGIEGGRTLRWEATVQGRMIVGLGTESLRETSITVQHTWGVPVIPGSALKGLAASAAHHFGGASLGKAVENATPGDDHRILFGDTTTAGVVVFHDAWWMPKENKVPLDLDIMTVHHAAYYGKGEDAPADWDEPNPVAFVTARGTYLLALSGPPNWVECAGKWLELGLEHLGVGAKTAAGYGRMALKQLMSQQEKQLQNLQLALKQLPKQHNQPGTAWQAIPILQKALEAGVPVQEVHKAGLALWKACPSFWKKQRQDSTKVELLDHLGLVPPDVPTADTTAGNGLAVGTVEAIAWSGRDGKRPAFIVQIGNRRYKRRKDKVAVDQAVVQALGEATEDTAIRVRVVIEGDTLRKILPPA